MKLYTIGFTQKSAEEFFETLKKHDVKVLLDIRLNNSSQLAGFTKSKDLKYFLKQICGVKYEHDLNLAPTKEMVEGYRKGEITWVQFGELFSELLNRRQAIDSVNELAGRNYESWCLLCSEVCADTCHRSIVANYIKGNNPDLDIEIIHL